MGYKLGSFNMYKFQAYRSDDEIKKNLDMIANIILAEKFDIIAMQEIFDSKPMEMVINRLGNMSYAGAWGRPNSRSSQAAEGFAFIWNKKRIGLAESLTASGKRIYQPRIYQQYRVDRKAGQKELVRDPFYGRFKPLDANFELRIINAHVMFSGGGDEEVIKSGDVQKRRNELDILIRNILAKENTMRYGNNLPAYTVLLGDYNLNLKRDWTTGPYLQEVVDIKDGKYSYHMRTAQDQLTTLKSKSKLNPDEPVRGFANNYDHFTYDEEKFAALKPRVRKIDTVRKYCGDDFEKHRKEISDHTPISMEINMG